MYLSKIALVCLVIVGSSVNARPQVTDYSDITDENDPRFMFDANPQYSYKYQVSDDPEQTYIAHNEARDGAAVQGEYSYVDPYGSLITVSYVADDDGYRETRNVQESFVTIRAKPKKEVTTAVVAAPRPAPQPRPAPRPRPAAPRPTNNDANLVANIIAQLTPFIKQTVSDSLGSRTTSRVVEVQQPVVAARPIPVQPTITSASGTSDIFGADGVNRIQVDTPTYSFDEFLS
jgi:hypothetical protein